MAWYTPSHEHDSDWKLCLYSVHRVIETLAYITIHTEAKNLGQQIIYSNNSSTKSDGMNENIKLSAAVT